MSDTATLKDQTKDWIGENPLRKWRKRNGLSMMDASVLLDVGMSSVQHWEQGAYQPTDESIDTLARVLGIKPRSLRRQWREWYNNRPQV